MKNCKFIREIQQQQQQREVSHISKCARSVVLVGMLFIFFFIKKTTFKSSTLSEQTKKYSEFRFQYIAAYFQYFQ